MSRHWTDIVLDQILFLETADDDDLNPDLALQQMEGIAAGLRSLPDDQRAAFQHRLDERMANASGERRELLLKLAEGIDLYDLRVTRYPLR